MKRRYGMLPPIAWVLAVPLLAAALWGVGEALEQVLIGWYFRIVILSGIAMIAAVSLNIVNGFTGQFSIGHAGFMLVGAYASAGITVFAHPHLVGAFQGLHVPQALQIPLEFVIAIAVGGLAAAVTGLLVGLPSLRLRGDYLAIATLGFGEAIRAIFVTVDAVGGASGLHNIPRFTSFAWVFLCAIAVVAMSRNLAMSSHGRALLAIRDDEIAAQAVGVDTFRYKVLAFLVAAGWAGVAGALLANYDTGIDPKSYGFMKSVEIVVMVVLGGLGSITGAVVAAVLLTWPTELLRLVPVVSEYRMVIYPLLLILLMLLRPQGLFGRREISLVSLFRRRKPPQAPAVHRKEGAR